MNFDDLRAGLRRGIEDAPQDEGMRVDLMLVLLKAVSELQNLNSLLAKIEASHRPEWEPLSYRDIPGPLTLPKE